MLLDVPTHAPNVFENYYADKTLAGLEVPVKHARERCPGVGSQAHPNHHHGTCR